MSESTRFMLRGLHSFERFDWTAFSKDKRFMVTRCSEWKEYQGDKHFGTRLECTIVLDKTEYPLTKKGEQITNRFREIVFNISKDIDVPVDSYVIPVDTVATVYGDFRNKLSVKAPDVVVQQPKS